LLLNICLHFFCLHFCREKCLDGSTFRCGAKNDIGYNVDNTGKSCTYVQVRSDNVELGLAAARAKSMKKGLYDDVIDQDFSTCSGLGITETVQNLEATAKCNRDAKAPHSQFCGDVYAGKIALTVCQARKCSDPLFTDDAKLAGAPCIKDVPVTDVDGNYQGCNLKKCANGVTLLDQQFITCTREVVASHVRRFGRIF
jgi:hypothetical protein